MASTTRRRASLVLAAVVALLASLLAGSSPAGAVPGSASTVFINEFHYDDVSTDDGEFIEIAGPAGEDLTGWSVVLYNGSSSQLSVYDTEVLSGALSDAGDGSGFLVVNYPTNGIQNGGPDGIALVDAGGSVVQFLSYEGSFTASDGPAAGQTSTDIGVAESSSTPEGQSLQLTGTGSTYADFTWVAPAANTSGSANNGQTFTFGPTVCDTAPFINEFHYDDVSTDDGEFIEIAGPAGEDLTGWSVVLYNGSSSQLSVYDTEVLSGALSDAGDGSGFLVVNYPTNGIQNGGPDGIALVDAGGSVVQFLSYEGSFTASDGPAAGQTSTDIGVAESSSTPEGQSLQLTGTGSTYADFTWVAPAANTSGSANNGQTFDCGGGTGGPGGGQPLPFTDGFDNDDCTVAGWQVVSVDADTANTWGCSASFSNAEANGFGDSAPADEWLITPALDMDAQTDETLKFRNQTGFTDSGQPYPQLEVVYSTDYDGAGDPTTATWTPLSGINFSPEDSNSWVDSGPVDLSGISGTEVYFAFHYVSSGTTGGSAARWRIDAVDFSVDSVTKIHEIQGSVLAPDPDTPTPFPSAGDPIDDSPLVGSTVTIEGVVTGWDDLAGQSNAGNIFHSDRGIFVQEEEADWDLDDTTSEGIFVQFSNASDDVADYPIGTTVQVTGTVAEHFELTVISSGATITTIDPTPQTLPPAVAIDPATIDRDGWEAVEGQRVVLAEGVANSGGTNRFGELVLTPGSTIDILVRPDTAPGLVALVGESGADNPAIPRKPEIPSPTTVRADLFDTVQNAEGPVAYSFDLYKIYIQPGALPTVVDTGVDYPYDELTPATPDQVRVTALNVENFFPVGVVHDGSAVTTQEYENKRDRIVDAIDTLLLRPDIVGIEEAYDLAVLQDVATQLGGYTAYLVEGNDNRGIDVGFLVKDTVTVNAVTQLGATEPDPTTDNCGDIAGLLFDRPPLLIEVTVNGVDFGVINNHWSSKAAPDSCRDAQATFVRDEVAALEAGGLPVIVTGDLNAFEDETPLGILEDGTTTLDNLWDTVPAGDAYSFQFAGVLQTLDHLLITDGFLPYEPEFMYAHFNTAFYNRQLDEPDLNSPFNDGHKFSDHDAPVLTLTIPSGPTCNGLAATIVGTEGDDVLLGTNGDDVIVGLGGNDTIRGRGGNDTICGGDGNDELRGDADDDTIFGELGGDTIYGATGTDTIDGGPGGDVIFAGSGPDIVDGGEQGDQVYGGGGADVIDGSGGGDDLRGNGGNDTLRGGDGADELRGNGGNDTLEGGAGNDRMWGNAGNDDTCDGGDGNADMAAGNCEVILNVP